MEIGDTKRRIKLTIYSSGKPRDSNLYSINYGPETICSMTPTLNAIKIDLKESGLSKILQFPDTQDYISIQEFEDYKFEGFECVPAGGTEYYFCFDQIAVLIIADRYSEAFRHFDGKPKSVLELCLGAVSEQREKLYIDELEFKKFIYETVAWDKAAL